MFQRVALLSLACSALARSTSSPLTVQDSVSNWNTMTDFEEARDFVVDWDERRLVQLEEDQEPVWMTELEKFSLKAQGVGFFDLTENLRDGLSMPESFVKKEFEYPKPSNDKLVTSVIDLLTISGMRTHLKTFTTFRTRDYRSASGKASQKWLLGRVAEVTDETASDSLKEKISITEFIHSFGQHSVIARINGSSDTDETVVLSAHQDSTNLFSPYLRAPGADDDGSGTVAILEVYHALLAADFQPARNLEFHWYAAEEGGLLGSQAVSINYAREHANVVGNLHFDTIATIPEGTDEAIGFVTDFTDPAATNFSISLVEKHCSPPAVTDPCGYGCSDHASWTKAGYSSASVSGSAPRHVKTLRKLHSPFDRSIEEHYSFDHLLEFAKLGVAYSIEMASVKD